MSILKQMQNYVICKGRIKDIIEIKNHFSINSKVFSPYLQNSTERGEYEKAAPAVPSCGCVNGDKFQCLFGVPVCVHLTFRFAKNKPFQGVVCSLS